MFQIGALLGKSKAHLVWTAARPGYIDITPSVHEEKGFDTIIDGYSWLIE